MNNLSYNFSKLGKKVSRQGFKPRTFGCRCQWSTNWAVLYKSGTHKTYDYDVWSLWMNKPQVKESPRNTGYAFNYPSMYKYVSSIFWTYIICILWIIMKFVAFLLILNFSKHLTLLISEEKKIHIFLFLTEFYQC